MAYTEFTLWLTPRKPLVPPWLAFSHWKVGEPCVPP